MHPKPHCASPALDQARFNILYACATALDSWIIGNGDLLRNVFENICSTGPYGRLPYFKILQSSAEAAASWRSFRRLAAKVLSDLP